MATELGIQSSSEKIQKLLAKLARTDLWHDFSKVNIKKILALLENSTQILDIGKDEDMNQSGGGTKKVDVRFITNKAGRRTNIFDFFEDTDFLIPKKEDPYKNEEELIEKILGPIYKNIRSSLEDNEDSYGLLNEVSTYKNVKSIKKPMLHPENEKEENKIHINVENGEILRTYIYSCYPTKLRGKYFNLPFAFEKLTNTRTFILLIDASYFCFTKLRSVDSLLTLVGDTYNPNQKYRFYILKNNENVSDSSVKIDLFDKGNNNVEIKILRERATSKIVYPSYKEDIKNQNRNLYTTLSITNQKVEDNVHALVEIKKNIIKTFPFLSKISCKTISSVLALQKVNELKEINEESLIYLLFKRAGDWCQALSLLDKTRIYDIYDYDTKQLEGSKNLFQLQDEGEIALVTHDRILFIYSILLGLNVFYSFRFESKGASTDTSEDGRHIVWGTYFKNTLDISSLVKVDILEKIDENKISGSIIEASTTYNTIIRELNNLKLPEIPENIYYDYTSSEFFEKKGENDYNPYSPSTNTKKRDYLTFLIGFIQDIRKWLSILGNIVSVEEMTSTKTELMEVYNKLKTGYSSAADKREYTRVNASNFLYLSDMKDKIDEMISINSSLNSIYSDEDRLKDEQIVRQYFLSNGSNKNLVYIFDKVKNDFEKGKKLIKVEIVDKGPDKKAEKVPEVDFISIIPFIAELKYNSISIGNNDRDRRTKNIICSFLILLRNNLLSEGYPPDLPNKCEVIDDRKERARSHIPSGINFLKKKKQGGSNKLEPIYNELLLLKSEKLETKYVNDENGRFYSVIDNYYVSSNEFYILEKGLKELKNDSLSRLVFLRFLIYYIDEIFSNIQALSDYDDNTFQDDLYIEHLRIYADLFNIQTYIQRQYKIIDVYFKNRKKWSVNYLEAFQTKLRGSFVEMIEKKLLPYHDRLRERIVEEYMSTLKSLNIKNKRTRNNRNNRNNKNSTRNNNNNLNNNNNNNNNRKTKRLKKNNKNRTSKLKIE
jgi:hypothetical protein